MDSGESLRRWGLAAAIIAFELTRWQVLLVLQPINSPVRRDYFDAAHAWVDQRLDPYRAAGWRLPPAALWLVAAPRVIDYRTQVTEPPRRIIWRYHDIYRRLLFAIDVAVFVALLAAVRQLQRGATVLAAWCYVVLTAPLGHVLYDRTELALAGVLLASAWCWARGLRSDRANLWLAASGMTLGFAAALSGAAMAMILALAAALGAGPKLPDGRRASGWRILAAAAVGWSLPYVVQSAATGATALRALALNGGHGLEVEAAAATIAYLARPFGLALSTSRQGTEHFLRHSGDSALFLLAVAAQAALVIAVVVAAARWRRRPQPALAPPTFDDCLRPWCFAALAGLAFAWFGVELPPEQFVWTLPLALWLGLARCEPRQLVWYLALLGSIVVLTTFVFPFTFYERPPGRVPSALRGSGLIPNFDPLPVGFLMLRNSLTAVLWAWGWRMVARGP